MTSQLKQPKKWSPYQIAILTLFSVQRRVRIVQVGANDGKINDPIYPITTLHPERTDIILVEPQKDLLPFLTENYQFHPNPLIHNGAVGPEGDFILYGVKPEYWEDINPDYAKGWPKYRAPTGIASSDRHKVEVWLKKNLPKGVSVNDALSELHIKSLPLRSILKKHKWAHSVDILQIDAEGFDDEVIYSSDLDTVKPKIICFESTHIKGQKQEKLMKFLSDHSYRIVMLQADAVAIRMVD